MCNFSRNAIIIAPMVTRILIRVVGFSDVERHALNTVFRLSQEPASGRSFSYEPWTEGDTEPIGLTLIDGASGTAAQELANLHHNPGIGLIWVGAVRPSNAWRTFNRPLRWPDVLSAMDMYFSPPSALGFDLANDSLPTQLQAVITQPADLEPGFGIKRALIADANREARLYLRSKFAALGITQLDEAASVTQAQALLGQHGYHIVCVDLGLADQDPWLAVAAAHAAPLRIVTGQNIGLGTKFTAKVHGCVMLEKPLDPVKLSKLLLNL
jgi:CheY-like chemotaxis protein